MVRRVVQLFYQEIKGLHQAAYVLALFALGSQLLALVRDRLLAHEFGASAQLDIYYTAFRIPDLLYVLFASVLSVYVLIPFVTRAEQGKISQSGSQVLSQIFTLFLVVYIVVAGLIALFAPTIVPILFPGFTADTDTLVNLLRILLLQPFLLGLSSLFGVVTQLGHRFVLYAVSPLIYNFGIILGIVFLYPILGLSGLVWGVVFGALGHMLIQWPFIQSSSLRFFVTQSISFPLLKEILIVAIPRAITLSLHQILLLSLVGIASMMAAGSISVFQFAFNLQSVPLAIIGVSYSVAAFPTLSRLYAEQKHNEFLTYVTSALRHIIFWAVPIVVLIIVLRAQMVRVLLGSGEFDWSATRLTAAILALLVISLAAQAINLLIIRSFYAVSKTAVPFWVTLASSVTALVTAYVLYAKLFVMPEVQTFFMSVMRLDGVVGSEVLALAIGYSVGMVFQTILLLWCANYAFKLPIQFLLRKFGEALMAALVGGVTAYATLNILAIGINPEYFVGIFIQGLVAGLAGVIGVIFTYYLLGSEELSETLLSYESKILKTDVVAPEDTL